MLGFAVVVAARAHHFLRRFMPTNILLDALHTRRGLKWGLPAMLLAVPYALAAVFCAGQVEAGGSGWLSALALLFVRNALKFLVAGPVALIQLIRLRAHDARGRRRDRVPQLSGGVDVERFETPTPRSNRQTPVRPK